MSRSYTTESGPRDYNAAVAALNTLQSNFSAVEAIKKLGPGWNKQALPEMREYARRIGYEVCVYHSINNHSHSTDTSHSPPTSID